MTPRHRLAISDDLHTHARIVLEDGPAHYLTQVLRLKSGDAVALFNGRHGEWKATLEDIRKKSVSLMVAEQLKPHMPSPDLTVCFAPIKGGRLETILEKATELGARVIQPVITTRTIVDKVNLTRAEAIIREAAEQSERTDWPEIREPVKLLNLLGDWPRDVPLIYGDESGASASFASLRGPLKAEAIQLPSPTKDGLLRFARNDAPSSWGILTGPEGGFTPEEFAALKHVQAAVGVGLGPRILRADTAVITLCALTMQAWGDWHNAPKYAI